MTLRRHDEPVPAKEPRTAEDGLVVGNGARRLWTAGGVWFLLAVLAGIGASRTHGGWHAATTALTVLLGALATWVLAFAALASGLIASFRRFDAGRPVPAWVWVVPSVGVGSLVGTGAYVDGPGDLLAVPLTCVALAAALTSASSISRTARYRVWCAFGIAAGALRRAHDLPDVATGSRR